MLPKLIRAILLLSGLSAQATAMTFQSTTTPDGRSVIVADGAIGFGDAARFINFLEWLPNGTVPFALSVNSAGGSISEAVQLARMLQAHRIAVAVLGPHTCASACFLLFAAAPARMVGPNALIGVHSASMDGRETMGALAVTTLMAREASALHVPPAVIGKMVITAPEDIAWLSVSDLREMGATLIEDDVAEKLMTLSAPPVVQSTTPYTGTQTYTYARDATRSALEQRAFGFVRQYFETWSADNDTANSFVDRAYAPTVDFYGKPVSRSAILAAKQAYTVRWPVRLYQPRPLAMQAACDADIGICNVTGVVDWDCKSVPRNAQSSGSSSFILRVDLTRSQGLILAESGSVVVRQAVR